MMGDINPQKKGISKYIKRNQQMLIFALIYLVAINRCV